MDIKTIVAMFTSVALAASSLLPTKTSKRCNTCLVFSRAPAIIWWFWWCKDSFEHRLRFSLKLANGAIHASFSDRWVGSCLCKFWLPNTTAAIPRTCAKMKDVLYRLLLFNKKWCCLARPSWLRIIVQQSRNQTFVGRFRFLLEAKAKAFKNYFFLNKFKKTTATTAANHLGAMLDDVQNFVCRKRFERAESKGRYNE